METSGDRATFTAIERTSYVFYDMVSFFTSSCRSMPELLSLDGKETKGLLLATSWPGLKFDCRYMHLFLLRQ